MTRAAAFRSEVAAAGRFVLAGGFNTLVTGVILSLLSIAIDPKIAYTVVFALGIALSTFLAGAFVFRRRMGWRRVGAYVVMYGLVYLVGLLALRWAIGRGLPERVSGLVVLVTAPLTFLGGRVIVGLEREPRPGETDGPEGSVGAE